MTVSAKSRYAVTALVELAERLDVRPGTPVKVADLAHSRGIPGQFLEQVFAALRRAGVLASRRGAAGGFLFARPPALVTVEDVVAVLDGRRHAERESPAGGQHDGDGAASVWSEAGAAYDAVLRRTTVADLLERERRARRRGGMYYI